MEAEEEVKRKDLLLAGREHLVTIGTAYDKFLSLNQCRLLINVKQLINACQRKQHQ